MGWEKNGGETAIEMIIESKVLLLESREKMAPEHTDFSI